MNGAPVLLSHARRERTSLGECVELASCACLRRETSIHGFNKPLGRPRLAFPAESPVVAFRGVCRLDMRQIQTLLHHRANLVSNNGQHVPVTDHFVRVAQPAIAGNHKGATLFTSLGNRYFENLIQGLDDAVDTPTVSEIDMRVSNE